MALPRTELKEDILPLHRARRALKECQMLLKEFSQTGSVEKDAGLSERVVELRRKLKKSKKLAKAVLNNGSTIPLTIPR